MADTKDKVLLQDSGASRSRLAMVGGTAALGALFCAGAFAGHAKLTAVAATLGAAAGATLMMVVLHDATKAAAATGRDAARPAWQEKVAAESPAVKKGGPLR